MITSYDILTTLIENLNPQNLIDEKLI